MIHSAVAYLASYRVCLHIPTVAVAAAAVVNYYQMTAVEVKPGAKSVRVVLFARKNHCSTIGQPFDSANSINQIQDFITMKIFFPIINLIIRILHLVVIDFHCSLPVAVVVVLENLELVDCIEDSFWIDVQTLNK